MALRLPRCVCVAGMSRAAEFLVGAALLGLELRELAAEAKELELAAGASADDASMGGEPRDRCAGPPAAGFPAEQEDQRGQNERDRGPQPDLRPDQDDARTGEDDSGEQPEIRRRPVPAHARLNPVLLGNGASALRAEPGVGGDGSAARAALND